MVRERSEEPKPLLTLKNFIFFLVCIFIKVIHRHSQIVSQALL